MIRSAERPLRFALVIVSLIILAALLAACNSTTPEPEITPDVLADTPLPTLALPSPTAPRSPEHIPIEEEALPTEVTPTVILPSFVATPQANVPGEAALAGCPVTQLPEVSQEATLTLGPSQGLPESTAEGDDLVIVGRVYADDCTPLEGASLNVWQTDPAGEYGPGHGGQEMECCYLQGSVQTDENGYYQLVTRMPGYYKGQPEPPPAHIHVEVGHPEAEGEMLEIVFAGDPYLPSRTLDGYVVTNLEHFAPPMERGDPYLYGVADMLLTRSQPVPGPTDGANLGSSSRTFEIIPESSEASYQIREKFAGLPLGTSAVAVTRLLEGSLTLDFSSSQTLVSMEVTADLRDLDSGEVNRDEKLVDRWLVTQEFPYARFVGQRIENGPESFPEGKPISFTLVGDLTIRDVTQPVSLQTNARLDGDRITGTASTAIRMTDYGIDPPDLLGMVTVEDEVLLTINLVAQEKIAGSGG